jgi:hypothetical protein
MWPPSVISPGTRQGGVAGRLRLVALLRRKLWLPRPVYLAIPWLYLGIGTASLMGGLYLPDSLWAYPYLVLLGLICFHVGLTVASLRHRRQGRRRLHRSEPASISPPVA